VVCPATECAKLLAALPASDRAPWATAAYAGLRRGELRALRIEDVNLGIGVIDPRHGWDPKDGAIEVVRSVHRHAHDAASQARVA
jgi:integrase